MTAFVDTWNRLGDAWVGWILERSVVSAVTLAVVAGVIALLRRRMSAHVPSRLYLLPLIVLVLPLERALPTRWPEPLPANAMALVGIDASRTDVDVPSATAPGDRFGAPGAAASAARVSSRTAGIVSDSARPRAPALALAAWILLIATGTLRLIARQRRGDSLLRRSSRPVDAGVQRLFERLRRAADIRRDVAIRVSPRLESPVTTGIRRPAVYLPLHAVAELTPSQLRFVLAHELEHVRRLDVLTEAVLRVARIGWFLHPGIWLTGAALARWRELACDEAALTRSRAKTRVPLADALFRMIDRANVQPTPAGAFAQHLSTKSFMRNRLSRILDSSRTPRRSLTPMSSAVLALTAVVALTAARAQQVSIATAAPQEPRDELTVALDQATTWLLRDQEEDGRWAIHAEPGRKYQRDHNEVHVTSLAVRALLPGLESPRREEIAPAIERGVAFLESTQTDAGRFGSEDPFTMMYGHGAALRALCAVQEVWPSDERLKRIERGVRYAEKVRNPYMGWRYMPRSNDNDSKITGMMLLALHDAQKLGIEVDQQAFTCGRSLLDQLTDDATGRTGFVSRGQTMSRFTSKKDDFPGELSEEPTAMAILVDMALGETPAESRTMRRGIALVADLPPEWSRERGSIDYSYWNFGAHAMAAVGGFQAELWRDKLRGALVANRIVQGGAAHWPAVDAWSHPGMEAYATASAMLALQALR